jgi:hypothetical protein
MTWRDKLEIGLKENARYRKDNLPENEVTGPEVPLGPGRSPEIPDARGTTTRIPATPGAEAPEEPPVVAEVHPAAPRDHE